MNTPADTTRRDFIRLQRVTLALIILNAFGLGITLTAWAMVALQIHSQSIIP